MNINKIMQNNIETKKIEGSDILEINFGPQHPSTHGVFRMIVQTEGEKIRGLRPIFGYLHRNHEQIAENLPYAAIMPYTDRLDYVNALANNFGYALTVEKLGGLEVPERAEYLRVIMAELARIVNHITVIGFMLNDLGAFFTPLLYAFRERERILDLFEEITGSRLMNNFFRFGGGITSCAPKRRRESLNSFLRTGPYTPNAAAWSLRTAKWTRPPAPCCWKSPSPIPSASCVRASSPGSVSPWR